MASGKGHTSWNKGIKGCWSKEAIDRIRAAQIGRTCWKAREIGDERIDKSGYIRVKVCNNKDKTKAWRLKHHVIYEKYHPGIKIEHPNKVIFIDGNNRNFDIDNLALVTLREQMILKNLGTPTSFEEGKTLINMAKLQASVIEKYGVEEYHRQRINEYYRNKRKEKRCKNQKILKNFQEH